VGDAAEGVNLSSHWNSDFSNPASLAFVAAFRAKHNRTPTYYAQQSYDTARAIGAALRQTRGSIEANPFRTAMLRADFASTRGNFRFNTNQYPIQNYYLREIQKDSQGRLVNRIVGQPVLTNHGDAYVKDCPMK
jgi:branched-chain amino acid transport system substrate-binding protein